MNWITRIKVALALSNVSLTTWICIVCVAVFVQCSFSLPISAYTRGRERIVCCTSTISHISIGVWTPTSMKLLSGIGFSRFIFVQLIPQEAVFIARSRFRKYQSMIAWSSLEASAKISSTGWMNISTIACMSKRYGWTSCYHRWSPSKNLCRANVFHLSYL